jgi:hypothetical protein
MAMSRSWATRLCFAASVVFPFFAGCGWLDLGNDQSIGRACDLTFSAASNQSAYNANAPECPSRICLKPTQDPMKAQLDPPTGATCSGECNEDSDCDGETRDSMNPADARCKGGFVCAMPFEVGPFACKKMCTCRDFLATPVATTTACQGPGAGVSSTRQSNATGVGQTSALYITLAPMRKIDLVTMIDNSPTMGPKIEKFTKAFPKFIAGLKDPDTGLLPDLRIAILDSDLGTGGAYTTGACGPKTLADGTQSMYGDTGHFQMRSSPTACAFAAGSLFLEQKNGIALNFSGDIANVFSCLAGNLGTAGCDVGEPLEGLEFGLAASNLQSQTQKTFLRPEAMLALMFVTDEDDCSAAVNDGMFGKKSELGGESVNLRCATRAHKCGGLNLTDSGPGYPTNASFSHPFSDCQARTDACPNPVDGAGTATDTSLPTACTPLRSTQSLANRLLALKDYPAEQVVAAGFFGWPLNDADMASAQYTIAPIPNPDTTDLAPPTVYDYWPVCYDPNHLPTLATTDPTTGYDATAAAWGARGGLRESAFLDELGLGGLKFSVCQPDFSASMESFAALLGAKTSNLCANDKLFDVLPDEPGVQPDCRVAYRYMYVSSDSWITYTEDPQSLPACGAGATSGNVDQDCWRLTVDTNRCPATGQRIDVLRTAAEIAAGPLPAGTKIGMHCQTCPNVPVGSPVPAGCDY